MIRCHSPKMLHPLVQPKFQLLETRLQQAHADGAVGVPFRIFETYRSPERQKQLYDQGRINQGKIVTNARPWESAHQYGLAADFVPYVRAGKPGTSGNGKWDWEAASDRDWGFLASCAAEVGLSVPIVWDRPHVCDELLWEDFRTIIQYHEQRG